MVDTNVKNEDICFNLFHLILNAPQEQNILAFIKGLLQDPLDPLLDYLRYRLT